MVEPKQKKKKQIDKLEIFQSDLEIINKLTGEILDGQIFFSPKKNTNPDLGIYHRYFRVPIQMTTTLYLCDLNKTDLEIIILLMKNCIKNNVVVFNQNLFAESLDVSVFTVARTMAKLKKMNLIKRLKLKHSYALWQVSPYISWMGSQEALKDALKEWEWPKPNKDREKHFKKFNVLFEPILKEERKKAFFS